MVDRRAMDDWEKEWRESRQIKCPHCGYILEGEEVYDYVSCWGHPDEEDTEAECPRCGKEFWVREHVDRTWEVKATEEEFS